MIVIVAAKEKWVNNLIANKFNLGKLQGHFKAGNAKKAKQFAVSWELTHEGSN